MREKIKKLISINMRRCPKNKDSVSFSSVHFILLLVDETTSKEVKLQAHISTFLNDCCVHINGWDLGAIFQCNSRFRTH